MRSWRTDLVTWIVLGVMIAFIYLPVVVLVLFSLQSGDLPVPPFDGPSLRWYGKALANDRLTGSLINSIVVGALSSGAATVLGFLAAYSLFRHRPAGDGWIRGLLVAPVAVSYLIIGLGLLIVFNMAGLGPSLVAVGIGHVIINLPLCFAVIQSQFGDHLRNIDNAAHDLGAGDVAAMLRVIAPVLMPSIVAAFCLSFTLSWDEFIISLLLSRFEVTLPVMIFELMRAGLTPEVNAAGTIVFAISIATALLATATIALQARRNR